MNPLLKTFVNFKLTTMSPKDLLEFGKKYDISMTQSQAEQVVRLIKKDNFNLFDDAKRRNILVAISEQIDPELSKAMDRLFQRFIKSQGK